MLILLLASVISLAVAQRQKTGFQNDIPSFEVCNILPNAAYYPSTPPDGAALYHNSSRDATVCGAGSKTYYITFTAPDGTEVPQSNDWGCPAKAGRPDIHCVSIDDKDDATDTCTPFNGNSTDSNFRRDAISSCFCLHVSPGLANHAGEPMSSLCCD